MTIEPVSIEDQLFIQLRTATVQRLRAAYRGDNGLCVLLARERAGCLRQLGVNSAAKRLQILSAA